MSKSRLDFVLYGDGMSSLCLGHKRASSVSRLWEATWGLGRESSAVHPSSRTSPLGLGAGCMTEPQR